MAENDKDFEFIKEQVIEKKRKKLKKRLLPIVMTIFLAILFGLIATATFVIAEPKFYDFLHKEEKPKTPVSFPTPTIEPTPEVTAAPVDNKGEGSTNPDNPDTTGEGQTQVYPVIQRIDANLTDFSRMYDEIHKVALGAEKSIVNIESTFTVVDWFNKTQNKTVETTGLIIADNTADYLILVSLDRIHDANSVRLKFSETAYADAVIQDYDSELNLALLAVAKEDIPPLYLSDLQQAALGDTYSVAAGSPIIALGSPNGHPGSMDIGFVSSKGSTVSITDNVLDLFNTDLVDNADSDGFIVDLKGEVVGIITRTLKEDLNKEINTVIGISKLKPYIEKMANKTPRTYFGVKADDMTENAKNEHDVKNGIYVNEVVSDSPAFDAGMKSGDIILSVDDENILSINNFNITISSLQPDTEITVKIKRTSGAEDKDMELKVVLAEKDE